MKLFNNEWSFLKTELGTEIDDIRGREAEFKPVDIPHDWLIYNTAALYEDSTGWYRKKISVRFGADDGKETGEVCLKASERAIIRFDGVYMDSTLYVNGKKAGDWKYGYSAFSFDITDELVQGENELLMQVRYQSPNSRWYSGAGIYRNVWLKIYHASYFPLDGMYVHTEYLDGTYRMEAETEAAGELPQGTRAAYYIAPLTEGEASFEYLGDGVLSCRADGSTVFELCRDMPNAAEWSLENTNRYILRAELMLPGADAPVDVQQTVIGFRHFDFDLEKGFFLNGKHVKLHGVCEHHDLGCLGSAFHKEAMRRKFAKLKQLGINALRTSHNMPAAQVMDLADEMGILVICEAFDMWERSKTPYDYARFFKEWSARDVKSWIRRDRNHPSLLFWSIGNEIYDTHADAHGQEIAKYLTEQVRLHDPKGNAKTTIGSNYMAWEGAQKCADISKVAGYNYAEKLYDGHHKEHPDWIIYGSETSSVVHSRGVYHFPLSQGVLTDDDLQCSALGNSTTSWGAVTTEACIADDRDAEFCLGQFLWSGFDYIGEPTPYHTKNSYFGYLDTAGFPKDAAYLLKAEWTSAEDEPMVHLYPYWDFNPGQIIDVRACTNGASVELFVNGSSYCRQEIDHKKGRKLQGNWQVPYCPGEIVAVAYDKDGRETARDSRHSFGDSAAIALTADRTQLRSDGEDLCFVTISTLDKDGYPVDNAMDYVALTLEGDGRLIGMDNGDSTDYDQYKSSVRKLFNGKLLAVVAAKKLPDGRQEGEIKINVSGHGLKSAQLTLAVRAADTEGRCCGEDAAAASGAAVMPPVPVRKIEITAPEGTAVTADNPKVPVEVRIYPADAADRELVWSVVNHKGIPVGFAYAEPDGSEDGVQRAYFTARGDGQFYLRCMSKSGGEHVRIISTLEFKAEGFGEAVLDPYHFVSAGLFSETQGDVRDGNEKGIATSREGESAVIFEALDFGAYGSDEITIPVFNIDGGAGNIEIWQGRPLEGKLLLSAVYDKAPHWNMYEEETWKLPERLSGVQTISLRTVNKKLHIKGFRFTECVKAWRKIWAAERDEIYGDSFTVQDKAITGIGNNVAIAYDGMDFGERGTDAVTLWSRSRLERNTIHLRFTSDSGEVMTAALEAEGTPDYGEQKISIGPLAGRGRVEFVFLPGTDIDIEAFMFNAGQQETGA